MHYCGCASIEEMQERAEFVEITTAGIRESHVHDVQITKEAVSYTHLDVYKRQTGAAHGHLLGGVVGCT